MFHARRYRSVQRIIVVRFRLKSDVVVCAKLPGVDVEAVTPNVSAATPLGIFFFFFDDEGGSDYSLTCIFIISVVLAGANNYVPL